MGENPEMRKDFGDNQIRRGKTVLFQNYFTSSKGSELSPWVQGILQGQAAFVAMDTESHERRAFAHNEKCIDKSY